MRILIADDDVISRRLLEATLVHLGHEVVSVENGTKAIVALLDPEGPRLAILDWMMPGTDGLTVCRTVRQRPRRMSTSSCSHHGTRDRTWSPASMPRPTTF